MWEFIFGVIVGSLGTIVFLTLFAVIATYTAFDTDRISERNKSRK